MKGQQRHATGPRPLNLQGFTSQVSMLGEGRFSTSFAGIRIAHRKVDIYLIRGRGERFLNAIARLDRRHVPYTVRYQAISYQQQLVTSRWLEAHYKKLLREGVALSSWGSREPEDAVMVALRRPTPSRWLRWPQRSANFAMAGQHVS
jgi:hypothetical protein